MFSMWSNSQNKVPPTSRRDDPFGWELGDAPENSPGRRQHAITPQKQGGKKRRQGQAGHVVGGSKRSQWVIGQLIQLGVRISSLREGAAPAGSASGTGAVGASATTSCRRTTGRHRMRRRRGRRRSKSRSIGRSLRLGCEKSDGGVLTIPSTHVSCRSWQERQMQVRRRGSLRYRLWMSFWIFSCQAGTAETPPQHQREGSGRESGQLAEVMGTGRNGRWWIIFRFASALGSIFGNSVSGKETPGRLHSFSFLSGSRKEEV